MLTSIFTAIFRFINKMLQYLQGVFYYPPVRGEVDFYKNLSNHAPQMPNYNPQIQKRQKKVTPHSARSMIGEIDEKINDIQLKLSKLSIDSKEYTNLAFSLTTLTLIRNLVEEVFVLQTSDD